MCIRDSINGENSAFDIRQNRPAWGIAEADLRITQGANFRDFEEDVFKADMEEDDRVDKVVSMGFYVTTLAGTEEKAPQFFPGRVYDDDFEKMGLGVYEGRNPVFEDEIALGYSSALEHNKTIGDTLDIFMEGQLRPFLVTGIFQSVDDLGKGFRIRLEGIQEYNPLYKLDRYHIKLEKGEDVASFEEDLLKTYGSTYRIQTTGDFEDMLTGILEGLADVILMLSLIHI